jgi:glutaredoxin
MKCLTSSLGIFVLSLSTFHVHAVIIHECVDENNETTYQNICSPGSESVNTFNLPVGKSEVLEPETILYVVPDCEACDITRNILNRHGLTNFTEVNIKYDTEAQSKLRKLIGSEGAVSVPTVILGDKQIVGLNKEKLINELEAAGFKEEGSDENAEVEEIKDDTSNEEEGE